MALHKWRRRQTKNFGEVWVPFAQIEIQAANGAFQPFVFQIDSGAVISLLRRSAADLLGIQLEIGRRIQLDSVGGAGTTAHVHELQSRFADNIAYRVPFAVATSETVPNLLGRLGVFDYLQFDFDGTLEETRIAPPWLDARQRRIWEFLIKTERKILDSWRATSQSDPVRRAVEHFLNRSGQTVASARALVKLNQCYAAPVLVRVLFELALQLEYILKDPVENAHRYFEFAHVTRYLKSKAITDNPEGFVSRGIAASLLRPEGEKRNKAEYDRVLPKFRNKRGKPDGNWYGMPLAELAKKLGRHAEYRLVYSLCSNWAHGDPTSLEQGPSENEFCNPVTALLLCSGYHARMLLLIGDFGKILLTREQFDFLQGLAAGMS